ncbi:CPBP family glutamic-type intramembrane protease [Halorubrum vacuolatum]|uniref:Membrane protease YdiL, CAAX protease family n=1 Tax=Halorubrum vacuolatum TaxID=63740 RepID=A0A238YIS1_HALVU|nr:CPBP family glutamic-type intramembrane protease [Halorubrum vacuolatum]SNR70621.1 Membrane protease YdiL, CAAX protease family [Halorubrum vacuolatum]
MSGEDCSTREQTLTAIQRDIRLGMQIAWADTIDLWRLNNTRRQQTLYGLFGLLMLPVGLVLLQQGYAIGIETRDGTDFPIVAAGRNLILPGLLVFAVIAGLSAAQSLARDSVRQLLLTSAPTRAIVIGKLLYLLGTWLAPLVFFFVPVSAYAVGAQSPLFPVALVVAGIPLLLLAMLTGLLLAYLLWLAIERLRLPDAVRRLVTASLSIGIFGAAVGAGLFSGQPTDAAEQVPTGEPVLFIGWYADLLFVGSPMAEPVGLQSALAAVFVLLGIPAVFAVKMRVSPVFWYATPGEKRKEGDQSSEHVTPEKGRPIPDTIRASNTIGRNSGLTARSRTLRLAMSYVRTAVRRPDQYVYLLYYLFLVMALLLPLVLESPSSLPPALGVGLVMLGLWFAGSLFCLNPLGTEGAMLSQLVLSETPGHTFAHARLLAGSALGFVLVVSGTLLFAATGPFTTPALAALGVVLLTGVVITSASFALGIGAAFPKFETAEVFGNVETLVPSVVAALVHGALTLFLGFMAVGLTVLIAFPDSPASPLQRTVGLGVFVLVLIAIADGSRRYAIVRLSQYGAEAVRVDGLFAIYTVSLLASGSLILGQVTGLTAALVVGFDRPVELLLPMLFVFEYLGLILVAFGFLWVTRRGLSYLDLGWPSMREIGIIIAGVGASFAIWATALVLIEGLGLPVSDHALFNAEDADPRLLLALIPLFLLVNGPVEELLYRNIVQKYLHEWFSTIPAIAIASIAFALFHIPAYLTAGFSALAVTLTLLFAISCLWGVIYVRTESLFVVSAIHGLYNALLVGGLYLSLVL